MKLQMKCYLLQKNPRSKVGTGGMKSKLLAAKTALSVGVPVFIGTGSR